MSYARASGPGGQHVNKVATKVVLRFSVTDSPSLGEVRRARLLERLAHRITASGDLIVQAGRRRERSRNLEDARERLADTLRAALVVSPTRKPTRPTRGSRERRLDTKRRQGQRKQTRRRPTEE